MPLLMKTAVKRANQCVMWQVFRDWLKGKPTRDQLNHLRAYLEYEVLPYDLHSPPAPCCTMDTRWLQVYNYLNKMAGKGLISSPWSRELEEDRINVLRG